MVIKIIFFIGDTHFYQDKLLQYSKRDFDSVQQMNQVIVENWNNVVKNSDIVFVLGDFSFGSMEETKSICDQLKGTKYLIKGNWDKFKFEKTWQEIGFEKLFEKSFEFYMSENENSKHLRKFILSHHPIEIPSGEINIHAHLHLDDLGLEYPYLNPDNHVCVSAERIGYTPISLENLIEIIKRRD